MDVLSPIEAHLTAAEQALGLTITVHDLTGIFHDRHGRPLLDRRFQSHQRAAVCRIGFCERCVEHCRHHLHARGAEERRPFPSECWKGLAQLVVPLHRDGTHVATLYAGMWRGRRRGDASLPAAWRAERELLSRLTAGDREALLATLQLVAEGLLVALARLQEIPERRGATARMRILDFLRRRACDAPRLADLAAELGLSSSRTSHLVREACAASFQDLVRRERILRARTLLLGTDESVAEIAQRVGYDDPARFSRSFKQVVGCSPRAFRQDPRIASFPPPGQDAGR